MNTETVGQLENVSRGRDIHFLSKVIRRDLHMFSCDICELLSHTFGSHTGARLEGETFQDPTMLFTETDSVQMSHSLHSLDKPAL